MKRATPLVHESISHLLRCLCGIGCAIVLMALVAALGGCGGGDMPDEEDLRAQIPERPASEASR